MTNAAPTIDAEPIFILTERQYRDGTEYLLDSMGNFDPAVYREDIPKLGIDRIALDDWNQVWTQGYEVFLTEDAATIALDADTAYGPRYRHVLTLHLDDVREALRVAFGSE